MVGAIILLPGAALARVWAWTPLLGIACAERLNLEGDATARHIMFDPAKLEVR